MFSVWVFGVDRIDLSVTTLAEAPAPRPGDGEAVLRCAATACA
jgi:hypothetical protein